MPIPRSGEERTDLQCLGLGCAGGERSSSRSPIGGASRSQAACVEAPELRPPDLDPAGASGAAVAMTLGRGGGGKGRRGGGERSRRRWRQGASNAAERNVRGEVRDWVVAWWRRMECGRRRHTMRYGRSGSMDGRTAEPGRQTTLALLICCTDLFSFLALTFIYVNVVLISLCKSATM